MAILSNRTKYIRVINGRDSFNFLAPELFSLILAHSVYKIWIKQESNMLDLWNKLHFEEEKAESIYRV